MQNTLLFEKTSPYLIKPSPLPPPRSYAGILQGRGGFTEEVPSKWGGSHRYSTSPGRHVRVSLTVLIGILEPCAALLVNLFRCPGEFLGETLRGLCGNALGP
jgi:hypothetical protein